MSLQNQFKLKQSPEFVIFKNSELVVLSVQQRIKI